MKESTVSSTTLKSRAAALVSICQRLIMIMVSSKEWKALQRDIESFAACLDNCVEFLDETNAKMKVNHERIVPARSIDRASVGYRPCAKYVESQYL